MAADNLPPSQKHTPGPWKLSHSGYANAPFVLHVGDVNPNYNRRYPLQGVDWIAEIRDDESEDHPRYEANARLIAAAPQLLAILKTIVAQLHNTCVSDMESGDAMCVSVDEAKAAIAKAEGR
jgi:hypothetical protein